MGPNHPLVLNLVMSENYSPDQSVLIIDMLKITTHQIETFQAADLHRFENELIVRLRENFTLLFEKHNLEDDRLRQIIQQGIARAKDYQIFGEYDITRFIEYAFEYGNGFESLPWIYPVLTASHLSGQEKMDRLDAISTFVLR